MTGNILWQFGTLKRSTPNRSADSPNKMNDKSLETTETTIAKNGNVEAPIINEKSGAISADISLPNELLERLYQRYSIKQRRAGLECFLAASVLFDLWAIIVPHQEKSYESMGKFTLWFHFVYRHSGCREGKDGILFHLHYFWDVYFTHVLTLFKPHTWYWHKFFSANFLAVTLVWKLNAITRARE